MSTIQSIHHKKVGTSGYVAYVIEETWDGYSNNWNSVKESGYLDSRETAQAWASLALTYFSDRTENGVEYHYTVMVEHRHWVELSFSYEGELILDAEEQIIDSQDGWVEDDGTPAGRFLWTEPEKP
jgi:hypothetical protein